MWMPLKGHDIQVKRQRKDGSSSTLCKETFQLGRTGLVKAQGPPILHLLLCTRWSTRFMSALIFRFAFAIKTLVKNHVYFVEYICLPRLPLLVLRFSFVYCC